MIIKLIWLGCSLIVFKHLIIYYIKSEVSTWGEVDAETLILYIVISLLGSLFGPIAILLYLFYNIIAGIAEVISEEHNKDKEWRYKSDPR